MAHSRAWVADAVRKIEADFNRSADTHLFRLDIPGAPGIPLYLKDESTHPTGSLKHRLARSLFLYGLCNGWIGDNTTVIDGQCQGTNGVAFVSPENPTCLSLESDHSCLGEFGVAPTFGHLFRQLAQVGDAFVVCDQDFARTGGALDLGDGLAIDGIEDGDRPTIFERCIHSVADGDDAPLVFRRDFRAGAATRSDPPDSTHGLEDLAEQLG